MRIALGALHRLLGCGLLGCGLLGCGNSTPAPADVGAEDANILDGALHDADELDGTMAADGAAPDTTPPIDISPPMDGGVDAHATDGGATDSGRTDSGAVDAGSPHDAGPPHDAAPTDAGPPPPDCGDIDGVYSVTGHVSNPVVCGELRFSTCTVREGATPHIRRLTCDMYSRTCTLNAACLCTAPGVVVDFPAGTATVQALEEMCVFDMTM